MDVNKISQMSASAEIVVVGSCNTDLMSYTTRLPLPGETIHGIDFRMGCGGKGANQCVAAAKLGASIAMIAKVGNDMFGQKFCQVFEELGIDSNHVKCVEDSPTGAATIIVDIKGENSIVVVAGANLSLSEQDILDAENLIGQSKIVLCQGEITEKTTIKALTLASHHKVMTMMNAAPADATMNEEIFKLADIFCVNETEAEILTGIFVSSPDDAVKACRALIAKGCTIVIVTLGSKGAVFCTCDNNFHVDSPKVTSVVDTTGAGDAFVGALAYFITKSGDNIDWRDSIVKACQVAGHSVQYKGTQSSFPSLHDLN